MSGAYVPERGMSCETEFNPQAERAGWPSSCAGDLAEVLQPQSGACTRVPDHLSREKRIRLKLKSLRAFGRRARSSAIRSRAWTGGPERAHPVLARFRTPSCRKSQARILALVDPGA